MSESEIMNWLGCFGEVLSEILEEQFKTVGLDPSLPPIGNGTYLVKIKIVKSLPNWVPMYGKKICFDILVSENNVTTATVPMLRNSADLKEWA